MTLVLIATVGATTVFAAGDPLSVINNLSTFIFSLIRAIGLILLGFGVVQVGLSLKSHDPSQRANGFLTLAGGVIITFAKEILDLIIGIRDDVADYYSAFDILAFPSTYRCSLRSEPPL